MHIPKAARLMLKSFFKLDDEFFAQLEKIDLGELQSQLLRTVEQTREAVPKIVERVAAMENTVSEMKFVQNEIHAMLTEVREMLIIRDGGIPDNLSVALDYEGREMDEKLLLEQMENL